MNHTELVITRQYRLDPFLHKPPPDPAEVQTMSTSETTAQAPEKKPNRVFATLQRLGRCLMLPIAVLPAAGILLRIGQADLLGAIPGFEGGAAVISAAGSAVFTWLPLIFAVGIAIGWAKKADGSTALAAVVGYMVIDGVFKAMSPLVLAGQVDPAGKPALINYGVLAGIVVGLLSAMLWQRFYRTKLPDFLGFFSGRRLVPILTSVASLVAGVVLALVYPFFNAGLSAVGEAVSGNAVVGGGIYGFANRMLIPAGRPNIMMGKNPVMKMPAEGSPAKKRLRSPRTSWPEASV